MNADPLEIQKFGELAHRWWDPESEFRPLHEINLLRLEWIDRHCSLNGKRVLDVGCGGVSRRGHGARGASVTGIDLSDKALAVARLHLYESNLSVDYRHQSAESLAEEMPAAFDAVTCMEMLGTRPIREASCVPARPW